MDAIGGTIGERSFAADLLIADLDHPANPSLSKIGSNRPTDLEAMPFGGDSGGGLFIPTEAGAWVLIGIFSGVRVSHDDLQNDAVGLFGSLMWWTRVSAHSDWIDSVLSAGKMAARDSLPQPFWSPPPLRYGRTAEWDQDSQATTRADAAES